MTVYAHGDLPPVFAGLGGAGDDDDFCFDVLRKIRSDKLREISDASLLRLVS
jgi:hypothetical protein